MDDADPPEDGAESPEDEADPPELAVPPSSDVRYTEGCFLLRFLCLGQAATVPGRHVPLQK